MYDVTQRQSSNNLMTWFDSIRQYLHSNIIIMLIGDNNNLNCKREVKKDYMKY